MKVLRNTQLACLVAAGLSGCGVSGADPTGISSMVQFERHRQRSLRMQEEVLSTERKDEVEANIRNGLEFCKQNIDADGCRDVVRNEATILQSSRDMKMIGRR